MYLYVNILHGWAMSQKMSGNVFKWQKNVKV